MSDLGTRFEDKQALAGMEEPREPISMEDARKAQEVAKEAHAHASPEDRPIEMMGNHHHVHAHPEK